MENTYTQAPVAALSLQGLLSKITLDASERKLVDSTVAKIGEVLALGTRCTPPPAFDSTRPNHLHIEADRLGALVTENPTAENVEAYHLAIIRSQDAEKSAPHINACLRIAWSKMVDSLQPVALGILDRVENLLDSESSKVRASILEADKVFGAGGDVSTFDSRLLATRQSISAERNRVCQETASLQWLHENGFCGNPFMAPAAPKAAPLPEIPLVRGRQKLPVELLAAE